MSVALTSTDVAPKFSPPPISIPRTKYELNELTAIANESLDVAIQIQLEKRLILDVQQALLGCNTTMQSDPAAEEVFDSAIE